MGKIVVPIDGSKHSLSALEYAINLVKSTEDELILLNVQPKLEEFDLKHRYNNQEIVEINQNKGMEVLQSAIKLTEDAGVSYESIIRTGIPTIEISSEAKEKNVDSIIMGSRGVGPEVGKAIGSVSYSLLHLTPCPLTFVPMQT